MLAHIMTSFTINGNTVKALGWFDTLVYTTLMVKEGISILEDIGAIVELLLITLLTLNRIVLVIMLQV